MVISALYKHKQLFPSIRPVCGTILAAPSLPTMQSLAHELTSAITQQIADLRQHCASSSHSSPTTLSGKRGPSSFLSPPPAPAPHPELERPTLTVIQSRREIRLPGISLAYLGRRDEKQNIYPHIDLTGDGAAKYGVSRRHARIHQSDEGIQIEDVGSTNGSFINEQPLIPFKRYPLQHGDVLQFGQLKATLNIPLQE
jgi:hypothetical protein